MSPSTTVRRAGVVTASALALSLGGAFTAASASALTVCLPPKILTSTGSCINKTVGSVVQPTPTKSSGGSTGSSSGQVNVPLPSLPLPKPTSSGSGGSSSGGSSGSSGSGGVLPRLPVVSDLPVVGGLTGGGSSGGSGGLGGGLGGGGLGGGTTGQPTVPGSTGTTTATGNGASVPGSTPGAPAADGGGVLSPASAYLPTSSILGFSNFAGSGATSIPTSSNLSAIPSPLLANQPASQLAAVQAPLLAAGEDAGRGGTMLASFGGYALPGLLVVLATAVVATVGAGNVRVWQARMATRRR